MICTIDNCNSMVRANKMCSHHYNKWYSHGNPLHKNEWDNAPEICTVDGCNKKANRKSSKMCETHYYRVRRNGTIKLKDIKAKEVFINQAGYIKDLDREHPLSDSTGYVYRHRRVLFDSGPEMACVHCGKERTWSDCHVDHLDDNIKNNNLYNLGISCPECNMIRGSEKAKQSIRDRYAVYEFNGETLCISEWAARIGISDTSFKRRLDKWANREDIFTKPRGNTGPESKCHCKKTEIEKQNRRKR